jgi:DNA-binding MarR family transcriptional regulator
MQSDDDNMDVNIRKPSDRIHGWQLEALLDLLRGCGHRLGTVADRLHQDGAGTAVRRDVLRALDHGGPQTVPDIARARDVSRQHIQSVVNGLLDDGLVERAPNPAHRRSRLVRLTAAGGREVEAMVQREASLVHELDLGIPQADLEAALRVLARLRDRLADEGSRRGSGS